MPLLSIQDKISEALESNEYSLGILLALANAFPKANHNILLKIFSDYDIRGVLRQLNIFV